MNRILLIFFLVACTFISSEAGAQPGTIDTTFAVSGKLVDPISNSLVFHGIAIQTDGKILTTRYSGDSAFLIRYDTTGVIDSSFGINGRSRIAFDNPLIYKSYITKIIITTDNKILAGGQVFINGQNSYFGLARFHSTGILDSTFGINGIAKISIGFYSGSSSWSRPYDFAVQTDGKIVQAGYSILNSNYDAPALVRYNSNGILDSSFGNNGIDTPRFNPAGGAVYQIAIQNDGKILMALNRTNGDLIARLLPNGTIDSSFGTNGRCDSLPGKAGYGLGIMNNGRIIVGFGHPWPFTLGGYKTTGELDSSFGNNGIVTTLIYYDSMFSHYEFLRDIAIENGNKIIAAGKTTFSQLNPFKSYDEFAMARYDSDGNVDSSFGINGRTITSIDEYNATAYQIALHSNKIYLLGEITDQFGHAGKAIARYNLEPLHSCSENLWTGVVSSDWNVAGNWICNTVPASGSDVKIPATAHNPLLTTSVTIRNLNLLGTLTLNSHSLTINGVVTGPGMFTGDANASLIINGAAGNINFTPDNEYLHSLMINPSASAIINNNLIIVGH